MSGFCGLPLCFLQHATLVSHCYRAHSAPAVTRTFKHISFCFVKRQKRTEWVRRVRWRQREGVGLLKTFPEERAAAGGGGDDGSMSRAGWMGGWSFLYASLAQVLMEFGMRSFQLNTTWAHHLPLLKSPPVTAPVPPNVTVQSLYGYTALMFLFYQCMFLFLWCDQGRRQDFLQRWL